MVSILSKWTVRGLQLAKEISTWSKDPSTKVGAVIMKDKRIVGHGFNGFPPSIPDLPNWLNSREEKYKMVIHAEANAILNSDKNRLNGSCLFVFPLPICPSCARLVLAVGISSVVCWVPEENERWNDGETKEIFQRGGATYRTVSCL